MTTTTPAKPTPIAKPLPEAPKLFPPSAELGEQLRNLGQEQMEIDRKKAEDLARLREIQDRD